METARNIAAAQTKKLREYVKPREYLPGEASLHVRNISERRYIYGDERRAEMDRLTIPDKKIDGGVRRAFIDTKAVKENAMTIYWALKKYEDTGLTPEQIIELKERDTAKAPEEIQDAFGDGRLICPHCRNSVINYFNRSRPPRFCMICGQRLKFGE